MNRRNALFRASVIGLFDDAVALRCAAARIRAVQWPRWDCHSPYPIHGLDEAMGLRGSWIPALGLAAGFAGVILAKAMQWHTSARDYPLMIGGKPLFSLPAFVPVTFELFVLLGALTVFASLICACRLLRWRSCLHDAGVMAEVSSHRFAIVLEAGAEARFAAAAAQALLRECGCADSPIVVETE